MPLGLYQNRCTETKVSTVTNLRKFFENRIECVRSAAEVSSVAVLAFDVRSQLAVERRRVSEIPVYSANHRTDGLVA